MRKYDKLVRDKIPNIIRSGGEEYVVEFVNDSRKAELLEAKLQEEVGEFLEDKNLEELADIMEVIFGLAKSLGYSEEELIDKRNEKREERGGFDSGVVLKEVRETSI